MAYEVALDLQRAAARARIAGDLNSDLLLLVEHPPVVTLGRTARESHLEVSAQALAAQGIELFEVERGGDVTFHGPGQLVGYPILDLKGLKPDLHWYLRQVEAVLIRTLARHGLPAVRIPGFTGVWTAGEGVAGEPAPEGGTGHSEGTGGGAPGIGNRGAAGTPVDPLRVVTPASVEAPGPVQVTLRKIASIGVHVRDWVTRHGFALNVNTDLRYFDLMVPCGIPDVTMTSLAAELGRPVPMDQVRSDVAEAFRAIFGYEELVETDASELRFPAAT